jgi:hypothetical protein
MRRMSILNAAPHRAERIVRILYAISVLALLTPPPSFAVTDLSGCVQLQYCEIRLTGTITAKDAAEITAVAGRMNETTGNLTIVLDSPGGDVNAAMAIGRLLRRVQGTAVVPPRATCASACVLVLAGGVNRRHLNGRVGIHSPYDPTDLPADYAAAKKKLDSIRKAVSAYLEEMNVAPALFDEMLRTPSHQIKYLDFFELERFGIVAQDPAFVMAHDAELAREHGIPLAEVLRRKALRDKHCPWGPDLMGVAACVESVMKTGQPPKPTR